MRDEIPWRYVSTSVQGTSHFTGRTPCQDASLIQELHTTAGEPVLVLLAADGAGSATHSEVGSKLVCHIILELVLHWLQSGGELPELTREIVSGWFETKIRDVFQTQAEATDSTARDFATTVLCAIVGTQHVVYFQVGDGAIVVAHSTNAYRTIFWPQSRSRNCATVAGRTATASDQADVDRAVKTNLVDKAPA